MFSDRLGKLKFIIFLCGLMLSLHSAHLYALASKPQAPSRIDPNFQVSDDRWLLTIACLEVGLSVPKNPCGPKGKADLEKCMGGQCATMAVTGANRLSDGLFCASWVALKYLLNFDDGGNKNQGHSFLILEGLETDPDKIKKFGETWLWAADFILHNPGEVKKSFLFHREGRVRTGSFDYSKGEHEISEEDRNHLCWLCYDPEKKSFVPTGKKICIKFDGRFIHSHISFYVDKEQAKRLQERIKKEQITKAPRLSIVGNNCAKWSLKKTREVLPLLVDSTSRIPLVPKALAGLLKNGLPTMAIEAMKTGDLSTLESCLTNDPELMVPDLGYPHLNVPPLIYLLNKIAQVGPDSKSDEIFSYLACKPCQHSQIDYKGDTPLMWAITRALWPYGLELLEKGSSRTEVLNHYKDHRSALLLAVKVRNVHMVKRLLSYGADITHRDSRSYSPLLIAVDLRDIPMTRALLEEYLKRNEAIPNLYHAVESEDEEIVRLFLDAGAGVNDLTPPSVYSSGNYRFRMPEAPLMLAVHLGQINLVTLLLDVPGIDLNLASSHGHTALDYAHHRRVKFTCFGLISLNEYNHIHDQLVRRGAEKGRNAGLLTWWMNNDDVPHIPCRPK